MKIVSVRVVPIFKKCEKRVVIFLKNKKVVWSNLKKNVNIRVGSTF